jgi:hypothetical protein
MVWHMGGAYVKWPTVKLNCQTRVTLFAVQNAFAPKNDLPLIMTISCSISTVERDAYLESGHKIPRVSSATIAKEP